ncbi:MAG TPA: TetR/AcrR family transcriptional regulator [Acidimicrobiia bacterium]|jgi:AcrR family transcriptional regulator
MVSTPEETSLDTSLPDPSPPETSPQGATRVEPPWWRPTRPSRRRAPLSRDQIIEAALKVVDADGVDALTVRRLGDELNTGSATIYWYISGKDELGELIYDHVMGAIVLPEPDPERWQEQFKDLARQSYRLLVQHNDLVRLSLGRIPVGPNMLRVMEWSIALMREAGLPDEAVVYAGDILGRYIDASVLEVTSQGGAPPELIAQHFASLPAAEYPNLVRLLGPKANGEMYRHNTAPFEFGLDLLVRGLEALEKTL